MKIRRIVVRLDPALRSRDVLDAAASLAEKLEAELVGLFVENIDLLHFAGFSFAREVGFPSATPRVLDVAAMQRALRARAKEARESLALATAHTPVRWSFRVERTEDARTSCFVCETDLIIAHLAHLEELRRSAGTQVVHAGDVNGLHAALDREDDGILVLAGSDDVQIGETLRKVRERVST